MSFPHRHVHVITVHEDGEATLPAAVFSSSSGVWLCDDGEADALATDLRRTWR